MSFVTPRASTKNRDKDREPLAFTPKNILLLQVDKIDERIVHIVCACKVTVAELSKGAEVGKISNRLQFLSVYPLHLFPFFPAFVLVSFPLAASARCVIYLSRGCVAHPQRPPAPSAADAQIQIIIPLFEGTQFDILPPCTRVYTHTDTRSLTLEYVCLPMPRMSVYKPFLINAVVCA